MDNKDKQALIDGTATIPYKLHILNDDGSIKDTLTEEDIVSTDYEDYRYVDSSSLCIGQFVARKLKGEIKTIDKDLQIEDKEISVEMGVNRNDGSKVYDITIDGKSEQETRSGKNLLKNTNVNSGDNNYWSSYSTFNESTNTLTRSTTATTESFISHTLNGIKSGTQYTLSLEAKSNGYVKHMDLYCYNSSVSGIKNKLRIPLTTDYQKITWTFTTDSSIDYSTNSTIRIDNNGSTTSGTEAILTVRNVMLVEGTDTDFEPYGASPSPDYPSEIKTVKGVRNLFLPTLKNNGVDITKVNCSVSLENDEYTFVASGNDMYFGQVIASGSNYADSVGTLYEVEPNATYQLLLTNDLFQKNIITEYTNSKVSTGFKGIGNLFTTKNDTKYISIRFGYGSAVSGTTYKTKVQLAKTNKLLDYVPYGSWLQVKDTGKNLFDIEGRYETGTGITYTKNDDGSYTLNGTASGNNFLRGVCYLNEQHTISYSSSASNNNVFIRTRTGTPSAQTGIKDQLVISSTSGSLTSSKQFDFVEISIASGTTLNNFKIYIQLEKGSTATEYEPYKEQSILIDMNKPNLFDKDNANILNGWFGSTQQTIAMQSYNRTIYIPCKPNTTYTISKVSSAVFGGGYTNELPIEGTQVYGIVAGGNSTSVTVTTGKNAQYLVSRVVQTNVETLTEQEILDSIKIYEGYEPYYELSSIGDTKDELNIDKDGNVSITQNIGEVVLNGSKKWYSASAINNHYRYTTSIPNATTNQSIICYSNYFKGVSRAKLLNANEICAINTGAQILTDDHTTLDDFKTWLSTHPVTVKYVLDEPQTISLGKYDKIEKIDDTENITIQTNIDTTFTKISYNLINWYNLGNFLITKPTDDDVKDTLTFDSMDYTKKFNKSFDPSGITFPCTALQLAKYCCEECGVELATNEFLNYDFEVIDNQYTNEDTFRNVMQDIGKLAYSWIRIGWDNKCYIDFNYGEEVDEYNKIDNDNYYDLDLQQKQFGPVNRIVIGMSNVEGENVYIEDEKSIVEHGVTELQIYDNNLTYTPELRNKVIDSAKVLFGLTYTPMTLNTTGHPWLLGKEKVEVTGMNNTIYYTYPWDRTISYSGHIKSKLESKCDTKTETEYKYKGDVETVLKKTRIIVNKQENTITSLTQQTTSIQDDLQQNYYDKTQTNQLIQTSSTGITNTFSEAGGNNIFRNTGLWFEDSSTSYYIYPKSDLYPSNQTFTNGQRAYEFWDGLVLKEYYDKAANLTSLLLQNGYFEQKQQVPNGNYTVSFKYKKLIESATTKVIINNVEYNLTKLQDTEFRTGEQDSDGNYITQPLEVTDGYIFVRFYTNVNNSIIIYDLMVNAGSVKLAYSQNQNETTTDTVNISKGITITSSNTDTTFKANSDGIRTLNKNNEVLSEFTDKGMKNKQIEVTDEATIVQVLWQNVGDQTWLTRL